jgi:hypothetical protein
MLGRARRRRVEGEVTSQCVAEEGILTDIAVDAVLTRNAADPIPTGIAIDVAAREFDRGRLLAHNGGFIAERYDRL